MCVESVRYVARIENCILTSSISSSFCVVFDISGARPAAPRGPVWTAPLAFFARIVSMLALLEYNKIGARLGHTVVGGHGTAVCCALYPRILSSCLLLSTAAFKC